MAWQPGDAPQGHPLWEEQVELEREMLQAGYEAYKVRVGKAREAEEMTLIAPYRRAMDNLVVDMGDGVKAWIKNSARMNNKGIALEYIKGFDPHLSAYVTVRTILDRIGLPTQGRRKSTWPPVLALANTIGVSLEYEARMAAWIALEPKLFMGVQKKLKNQKATDAHKQRVNINRFNVLMREKLNWVDWTSDARKLVGLKLLDILCRATGQFHMETDASDARGKKQGRTVLVASEELTTHLATATEADERQQPHYMPTIMPPKRWEGSRGGAYYTPFVRAPGLISFKASNEEVQGIARDEYEALDMPRVFEALNKVQEVPWRINRKVLQVVNQAWERGMAIGKLPSRELAPLPPKPAGMSRPDLKGVEKTLAEAAWVLDHPDATREWKRKAAKAYGENARRASLGTSVLTTLALADKFADREFYFPHMLDFRGRMYPIPSYLQPQGNDLARGLLTFAQGRPITAENDGAGWLAIHLANCWGMDKVSYDGRIKWVDDNEALWVAIYENPLGTLEWAQRKDCWQTLAAIFEWVRFRIEGFGMVSSLPVRVDGTCNGIQHLSALMRDEVGGASVNLMSATAPRDIYGEVAANLQRKIEGIRDSGGRPGEFAQMWLDVFDGKIPREFTKNPVMVLPYGGTKESYYGSITKWMREDAKQALPDDAYKTAIPWMVDQLWDSVNEVVVQGRICMEWLKACAKCVVQIDQPIMWTTRTGFYVRHFYGNLERKVIKTQVNGKSMRFVNLTRGTKLAKRDQLQGISPNFVHSQDASVNMETVLLFMNGANDHLHPFTTIHDAFGTCAASMTSLFKCIREAFILVHEDNVLAQFRARCVEMLRDHLYTKNPEWTFEKAWEVAEDTVPHVPEWGNLDLEEVRNAEYFFA